MSSIPICVLGAFRELACEQAPGERENKNSVNEARLPRSAPIAGSLFAGYSCISRGGSQIVAPLVFWPKMQQIHHLTIPKFSISQSEAVYAAMISCESLTRYGYCIIVTWPNLVSAGTIIGDGDRKSRDSRAPMIWDNFSIFRTNCAILTSYIRADLRTRQGLSRGCCHVAWSNGESWEILLRIFHSDGRE